MLKKLMEDRREKMGEIDAHLEQLGVLYVEAMDLQRKTVRELENVFHSRGGRPFPGFLNSGVIEERITEAMMSAIGKGTVLRSLHDAAEKDLDWAVSGGMTNG